MASSVDFAVVDPDREGFSQIFPVRLSDLHNMLYPACQFCENLHKIGLLLYTGRNVTYRLLRRVVDHPAGGCSRLR